MKFEFYRKKLKNKLTVLFERRKMPVVSISSSVKYGAAYESLKQKGINHFLEHLTFKGTKTKSQEELAREVEKKGGILDAFTDEEVTSYWCKLPGKHLNRGINIVSDLVSNPKLDDKEFETEKKVVLEEIKMFHDNPIHHLSNKIKQMLYEKPFGMSILGEDEIIKRIKIQEIRDLFNKVYTTDSMILAVVGDADFDDICEKAGKIYLRTRRRKLDFKLKKINKEGVEKRKGLKQAHFIFGFHTPSLQEKARYIYDIAMTHLTEGMSSVLFKEIREKRGLAYVVKGYLDLGKIYGYGAIYAGALKEKLGEVKEIILREIKNLKNLQLKDFNEAKEQAIGMKKVTEENSTTAMNLLVLEEIGGNAEEYYKYDERINSVKLNEFRKISKLKAYSTYSLIPKS